MLPEKDFVYEKVNKKLEEVYEVEKPYIKENELLKELCSRCEKYMGEEHDYEECRDMICFDMFLATAYLLWATAWE